MSLTAQGKHKIAIINDAHRLNKTAQNALLKTLEEANENVILILVSSDDKKLLPTILSRCQKIRFNTVSEEELAKNIPGSVKNKKSVLFWSLGRPGLMLDLINDADALDNREKTADNIEKLFSQTAVGKFSLAEEMSKDSVSTIETLNLWTVILRENILKNKNFSILSAVFSLLSSASASFIKSSINPAAQRPKKDAFFVLNGPGNVFRQLFLRNRIKSDFLATKSSAKAFYHQMKLKLI